MVARSATLVGERKPRFGIHVHHDDAARFGVGMQGVAVAERAYQKAVQYAKDRVQSRDLAGSAGPVAIINHPDVRRMLMSMRAQIEGARALAYVGAAMSDKAHHASDETVRKQNQAAYEYFGADHQKLVNRDVFECDIYWRASTRRYGLHRRNWRSTILS